MAINTFNRVFTTTLTTTADSAAITIPNDTSYITISSKTDVLIWLLDDSGNEIALLPSGSNGDSKQTFAVFEIAGCDIKLKNDTSATSTVYVTAYSAK